MEMPLRVHNAPPGTITQHRNGYIWIKKADGTWQAQHRWVMENTQGAELEQNERVYHKDGDRTNNDKNNLVKIAFSLRPFKVLERSRVLYIPAPSRALYIKA